MSKTQLVVVLAVLLGSAQAAFADLFMTATRIVGGVQQIGFKGHSVLSAVSYAVTTASRASKTVLSDVEVLKVSDKSDGAYFAEAVRGARLENVCIQRTNNGSSASAPVVVQQILLGDVSISSLVPTLRSDDDQPLVAMSLNYDKIQVVTFKIDQTGAVTKEKDNDFCFDKAANKTCTSAGNISTACAAN